MCVCLWLLAFQTLHVCVCARLATFVSMSLRCSHFRDDLLILHLLVTHPSVASDLKFLICPEPS